MRVLFKQNIGSVSAAEEDLTVFNLKDSIEKTRQALEVAYSGFDNAVDVDIIDSYIYEINALQKRYRHLIELAEKEPDEDTEASYPKSAIRALVSHVFS